MNTLYQFFEQYADQPVPLDEIFLAEYKKLPALLRSQAFEASYNGNIKQYIITQQDVLLLYRKKNRLYKYADDLLFMLEEDFNDNLQHYKPVSQKRKAHLRKVYASQLEMLEALKDDPAFSGLKMPIDEFILPLGSELLTLQQAMYAHQFLEYVGRLKITNQIPDVDSFVEMLSVLNFNTLGFFKFIQKRMAEELGEIPQVHDKLLYLTSTKIQYTYLFYDSPFPWLMSMPDLHIQVSKWIDGQLTMLKYCQDTLPDLPVKKIKANINVYELACLFRVLEEEKILAENSGTEICRLIVQHFSTVGQTLLSYKSFYKKYRSSIDDIMVRQKMRRSLLNMAHKLA